MKPQFKPEEIYLDLSKLSDEQIKALPQIFENSGDKVLPETLSDLISGKITDGFKFLFYSPSGWNQNDYPLNGRTELTYSQFLDMMGESEEVLLVENKITRFEFITKENGREIVRYGEFTFQIQDNGKTLKVFQENKSNN